MDKASENELYKQISSIYEDKTIWLENIGFISQALYCDSVRIQAKALWVLGEIGLVYSEQIAAHVAEIADFQKSAEPLLRERSVTALGRIGRGDFSLIEAYFAELFSFAADKEPSVRLSFIWASENIATNTPTVYRDYMEIFASLLHDTDKRVRIEAPEIFRVLGKRRPEFVRPFVEQLQQISEIDKNRVVRIHSLGAIKAVISK